jgi:hypothetical protein
MEQSSARPDEAPVASQWQCGFFKFFELCLQLLTIFVQLLQGFVAIDEVTV